MFDSFEQFATGGIVANQGSDTAIPCIIYILPLIPVLKKAVEAGRKTLDFHILGGAGFRDIFFYEMFSKVVKEEHDIELTISFDSSGIFKGLMRGRMLHILCDDDIVRKVDLRTDVLDKRFISSMTTTDIIAHKIDNMSSRFNFKTINSSKIYCDESGTFPDDFRIYAAMLVLRTYADIQMMLKRKVSEIYPMYKAEDFESFSRECSLITQNLNQGKITRKQTAKTHAITNSLTMLKNLDVDFCKHIVNKYLAKDEFIDLDPSSTLMKV